MDILNIALAMFFFMVTYVCFTSYVNGPPVGFMGRHGNPVEKLESELLPAGYAAPDERHPATKGLGAPIKKGDGQTTKEVIFTQDFYPWWRSTRWWNYDGWLYQKPYYNYWRRPNYYNYWYSGRPLIIGGKRYYQREYQ